MAAATIDYDRLAQQHGGAPAVDYDALASLHGALPATPAQPGNALTSGHFLDTVKANYADALNPQGNATHQFGRGVTESLVSPLVHPLDTLASMGQSVRHPIATATNLAHGVAQDFRDNGAANASAHLLGQGAGSFLSGEFGARAGTALAKPLASVAPAIAETALKVRGADRAYGAEPGRAILDNTTGFTPQAVVDSARESLDRLHTEQANVLGSAPGAVDLTPTRAIGNETLSRSIKEGHPKTVKNINDLTKQLAYRVTPDGSFDLGQPIPSQIAPADAAALNRGLSSARTSWNPATATDTMNAAAGMMHHQLASSIADVVPEITPLNKQVQSLMPVVKRATAADLNAGFMQRLMGRVGSWSGALLGGFGGYEMGGVPGAVAGFALPELMTSPTVGMAAARTANAAPRVLPPALRGLGVGANPLFTGAATPKAK